VTTVGQIPGESLELKQAVTVGLVTTVGQIPGESLELKQSVGVGLVATVEQIPGEYRELNQGVGVGLAIMQGLAPTIPVGVEATATPGVGLVTAVGQIPDEYRELKQGVAVGLAVTGGLVPAALKDDQIGPTSGLATMAGLAPTLTTELKQAVDVGLAIAQGLVPAIQSGADVVATITPDVGLVATVELTPTLAVEYDKPRGHVTTKRRRRGKTPVYDLSQTAVAVVKLPYELTPQPIAYFDPAPVAIAGIDTSAVASIEGQLALLEEQKRLTARRRREEEEVITLWLRAA
jgi:hypothetical protein